MINESIKPISPDDARDQKTFPQGVIQAFNTLITENLIGGKALVTQHEVVQKIMLNMGINDREIVFRKGWLNIEDAYRRVGWEVKYDKPGIGEDFPAVFTFDEIKYTQRNR